MKQLLCFLLCLFTGTIFAQKPFIHRLSYQIDLSNPESQSASVLLKYKTAHADSTVFLLPSNWGEEFKLEYFKLSTIGNASKWNINADSSKLTCFHQPDASISIRYQMKNGVKDSISGTDEVFLMNLKPSNFSAFTNGLLLAVDDSVHAFSILDIQFKLPKSWKKIASNFGEGVRLKTGVIANNQVQNGYFLAGDYRVYHQQTTTGQELTFCIRGNWSFADQELADEVVVILDQQRKFWNDFTTNNFFVSLTPALSPNEHSVSYTGTGLMNAFVMNATNNKRVTPESLRYLLNHELMHHWIGGKIENAADEELSYWFSEGFTDYFARLNMRSSGSLTDEQYLNTLDSIFKVHYSSPYREYHNDSIKVHFWDNREIEKIPYNRGSIFALYLDNLIRKTTSGKANLTDVMRQMISQVLASGQNKQFNKTWFSESIKSVSGIDVVPLLDKYIIQGELIPVEEFNAVLQPDLKMTEMKIFSFGFISNKIGAKEEIITQILPNSGAQEAGLRPGDKITGYDMYFDPNKEGKVLVTRGDKSDWIAYFPYKIVSVPQFTEE